MRGWWWVRASIFTTAFTGCFGVAHVAEQLPKLTVQGIVFDSNAQRLADREITIAVANFYNTTQTFKAIESGSLDPESYDYQFCSRRTGPNG